MNSANQRAIYTVRYCLRQSKRISNYRGYSLEQESYNRWAARELLSRLEKDRVTPPLILIEEFRDQMDDYSCVNIRTSYVFSCAKDMAEWIIDLLLA